MAVFIVHHLHSLLIIGFFLIIQVKSSKIMYRKTIISHLEREPRMKTVLNKCIPAKVLGEFYINMINYQKKKKNRELLTHCTDLHITLSEGQQSDINGVYLANESICNYLIFDKAPKKGLQCLLGTDTRDIF